MSNSYYENGGDGYGMRSIVEVDSRVRNILDCLNELPKGKVLDIGCGDLYLAEVTKHEFTGIDINNSKPEIKKHDLSVTPYPVAQNYFDIVVCSEVLEHLFDPVSVIKEARRVIKPRGTFIVTVPNNDTVENFLGQFRSLIFDPSSAHSREHIRQYNSYNIGKLIQDNGFKVIQTMGNSPHMSPFFTDARLELKKLGTMSDIQIDQIIGRMFPHWCPGLLIKAVAV